MSRKIITIVFSILELQGTTIFDIEFMIPGFYNMLFCLHYLLQLLVCLLLKLLLLLLIKFPHCDLVLWMILAIEIELDDFIPGVLWDICGF